MNIRLTSIMVVVISTLILSLPLAFAYEESKQESKQSGQENQSVKQEGKQEKQENKDEQCKPGRGRFGPEAMFKELNLTDEQKAKLEAAHKSKMEAHKASREQFKTEMEALHEMISKPETKREDVNGLIAELNAMKAQHFSEMIDGIFEMKKILTPEQFAKMQELHKKRWGKRDGKHQGPPPGEGPEGGPGEGPEGEPGEGPAKN